MGRLDDILDRGTLRRWERVLARPDKMSSADLAAVRNRARGLSERLDEVARRAESCLVEAGPIPCPLHTDWAWRPALWCEGVETHALVCPKNGAALGPEAKIFHDCADGEVSVRQVPTTGRGVVPYAIAIEVYHFGGSFLSLSIDLPREAWSGLSRRHLIRVDAELEAERWIAPYVRLSVRHGPNVAQVVRQLEGDGFVDLDLGPTDLEDDRVTGAWVDRIFEAPAMTRVLVSDVTVSRRPRAAF